MYTQTRGQLVDEDDPNDETKIPKTATDLRYPLFPLEARQAQLEKITKCINSLKDLERRLILKTVDPSEFQQARDRISIIRTKTGYKKLTVRCEFKTCARGQPEIPVYQNLCGSCHRVPPKEAESLELDLVTLSNLISRLTYLQEQLGMSLSNLLSEAELKAVFEEVSSMAECI